MAVIKIVPMPGAVGDKGDEGAPGPQGQQGPAGQNGLPGTPALWSYQGAYNPAAAYAVGDVVVYQGQLYYTKSVTTAGTLPTNTTKFDLIAAKGADGTNGTNGTNGADGAPGAAGADGADGAPGAGFGIFYLGNYNPSSGYVPDIAVVRGSDGQLYLAKASGQLNDPVGNTAQWEVWIPKGQDGAPGTNGADALWNFIGAYDGGTSYAIGDVVTYDGQLWYRTHANGGTVGNTPSEGFIWALLAAKGADGSGNADIADFVFTDNYNGTGRSAITLPGDKGMTISAGEDSDLYLHAGDDIYIQTLGAGDDIHLNSADDIRFMTGIENNESVSPPQWSMNSEGELHLPGAGYISNPENSSGDGYGNDTLVLVPDGDITSDQYVIIDPTAPNHIHLRAGGVQDNSNAHIFLGGERNNIEVSDPYRTVKISTKPDGIENTYGNSNEASNTQFIHASTADIIVGDTVRLYTGGATYVVTTVTQDSPSAGFITVIADGLSFITGESYVFTRDQEYNNQWTFGNDGVLSGPAMGGIWVESIQKKSEQYGLGIYSPVDIVLEASNGEFLNDSSNPDNQIATIGDLPTGATGTFQTSDSKIVTVTNGIITSIESLT